MIEKFIECVSWEKMRKFEVDFGFLHLFVCFGDPICMETLFWCTCARVKSVSNDCAGHWSVKAYLFSTIGAVFVQKVRYVWM